MTGHRLARCSPEILLAQLMARPGVVVSDAANERHGTRLDRRTVRWRQRLAGGPALDCHLEMDRGANGVLLRLRVRPADGAVWPLPSPLRRLAVETWTAYRIAGLVRDAERAA